jgi:anti-anti-sigma factor
VLRCAGDEDISTMEQRRHELARVRRMRADIVVDLTDLVFADTSLMVDLAMVARRLGEHGRQLLIEGAQPQIRRLIELVGLHRLPGVTLA